MAQLTINVDDSIVPRIRAAYGVANNSELKQSIIDEVRAKVRSYERDLTAEVENAKIKTAEDAKQTAVQQTINNAENEIVLT
jgi:hypothetical protein